MSRQALEIRVPIPVGFDAGCRLQVYTDFGGGTIDTDRPLLGKAFDPFAGQHAAKGVGRQPVGRGRVGGRVASRPRVGIGRSRVGVTPVGTAAPFVSVAVDVPAAYGQWKFAVQAVDRLGRIQGEALTVLEAVVSGADPPPLRTFALSSYDSGTDQVTFGFAENIE